MHGRTEHEDLKIARKALEDSYVYMTMLRNFSVSVYTISIWSFLPAL
jgi:hypothetical protein